MDRKKITIAIPTYNRNSILRETILFLLPQVTVECQVLIIDNCSDEPVAETLADILSGFPSVTCQIVRNRVNIGGNANILRCFELCDTDWIWLLGDDDRVCPNAIATIFEHIVQHPTSAFINFYFQGLPYVRRKTFVTVGVSEFVEKIDWFNNVHFMSCGVFRTQNFLSELRVGMQYAYTCAPHVVLLLTSLRDKGVCCFSEVSIIAGQMFGAFAQTGNPITVALGLFTLLELPMRPMVRRTLARKMLAMYDNRNSQWLLFSQAFFEGSRLNDAEWAVYVYRQIISRSSYYPLSIFRRAEAKLYLFLLQHPKAAHGFLSVAYHLVRGRDFGSCYVDRFGRM